MNSEINNCNKDILKKNKRYKNLKIINVIILLIQIDLNIHQNIKIHFIYRIDIN